MEPSPPYRQRAPEPARREVRLLLREPVLARCPAVEALRTACPHRPIGRDLNAVPRIFRQSLFPSEHRNLPGLFRAELPVASEPHACSLSHDTVRRLAGLWRGQWIRVCRERAISFTGRLVKACGRGDQNTAGHPVRHHLCAAEHPINTRDCPKPLPIEAEDLGARVDPKRAVGCDEQAVDFGRARQFFGLPHQLESCAVIAVQPGIPFRPRCNRHGPARATARPGFEVLLPARKRGNYTPERRR